MFFKKKKLDPYNMNSDKKIRLLEKMLDEKDKEIEALHKYNGELLNRLEDGSADDIANAQYELGKALAAVRKQEHEYKKINREMEILKNHYKRDMEKAIAKIPSR